VKMVLCITEIISVLILEISHTYPMVSPVRGNFMEEKWLEFNESACAMNCQVMPRRFNMRSVFTCAGYLANVNL
jgi:hypothetical protein